jgi:rhodanese-related sulfurtransferase
LQGTPQLVTAAELAQERRDGALLLDTRPAEQFADLHIRGSIQISLMGNFASWAAIVIDPAQKQVLISEDANGTREAHNRLARVGLTNILGYSLADENEWRTKGLELASISVERCEHIRQIGTFWPYLAAAIACYRRHQTATSGIVADQILGRLRDDDLDQCGVDKLHLVRRRTFDAKADR